ncbi:MAG: hypothetical protein ACLQER_18720, partial [Streptosporangiaceae bacterium]
MTERRAVPGECPGPLPAADTETGLPGRWTALLDGPAGRPGWTAWLDGLAGRPGWTAWLDG